MSGFDLENFEFDGNLEILSRKELLELAKGKVSELKTTFEKHGKRANVKLQVKIHDPLTIRMIDKMGFTGGVLFVLMTEYMFFVQPENMYRWYIGCIVPLLALRYVTYHKSKWHYFLLDFCYFMQFLLIFHLLFFSHSRDMFLLVFSLSNGPLLWAIVTWRNSLVFHSLDKVTSVIIHVFPPLVTFCMRWYPKNNHNRAMDGDQFPSLGSVLGPSLVMYMMWQVAYLAKTEIVDRKKLQSDHGLLTSFRWMAQSKKGAAYKSMQMFGKGNELAGFVFAQLVYTILTLLPCVVIYASYISHCVLLTSILIICIYNGASFYIENFSKMYEKEVEEKVHKFHEKLKHSTSTPDMSTFAAAATDS